jgi:hypothetical protein
MEASEPTIGYHYQPQQRNFVVLVTIATFHTRCLGGVRSQRSQPREDQKSHLTMRHNGSKRADYWISLPATTEELCCFGYNRDLSRSLLGWCEVANITATSGSRVDSHHATLWKQASRLLDVTTSHNRGTLLFWLQSRPFTLAAWVV